MPRPVPDRITLRRADTGDFDAVCALLRDASLPLDGVPPELTHFIIAQRDDSIVGAIGLEHYGDSALLRSAVVHPSARGTGVGDALTRAIIEQARSSNVRDLVLLTTTAAEWFPRFGFTIISRADAPAALHESVEFKSACPASAVVMSLRLSA